MSEFAKNLRRLRLSHGLTLTQVGNELGVSKAAVSMYESGSREPTVTGLQKLASMLNVSIDDLLGFEVDEFAKCKSYWLACGFSIEETLTGEIEILFNESLEQLVVQDGKAIVREYEMLPINSREEFIRLTYEVESRIQGEIRQARGKLFNAIIEHSYEALGRVTATSDGVKTYKTQCRRESKRQFTLPRGKGAQ